VSRHAVAIITLLAAVTLADVTIALAGDGGSEPPPRIAIVESRPPTGVAIQSFSLATEDDALVITPTEGSPPARFVIELVGTNGRARTVVTQREGELAIRQERREGEEWITEERSRVPSDDGTISVELPIGLVGSPRWFSATAQDPSVDDAPRSFAPPYTYSDLAAAGDTPVSTSNRGSLTGADGDVRTIAVPTGPELRLDGSGLELSFTDSPPTDIDGVAVTRVTDAIQLRPAGVADSQAPLAAIIDHELGELRYEGDGAASVEPLQLEVVDGLPNPVTIDLSSLPVTMGDDSYVGMTRSIGLDNGSTIDVDGVDLPISSIARRDRPARIELGAPSASAGGSDRLFAVVGIVLSIGIAGAIVLVWNHRRERRRRRRGRQGMPFRP
jgi:hypothetical protein